MEQKPYVALARRCRPQCFAQVIGQEAIVTTLKNALRFKHVGHAYLFCGARGTGKTSLARLFAKALNCKNLNQNQEPCNQCTSCTEITAGHSLDLLEIDGASNRGIDDIRQINETVGYAPAGGRYKIYIIDEVHMLTKEAFNALLKTLEEPPSSAKFFFATTEPHKLLPTIISRCQRFDLQRLSPEKIQTKLRQIAANLNVHVEEEALALLAHKADGSLRDAESLFDQLLCFAGKVSDTISYSDAETALGTTPRSTFFALDNAILCCNLSFAFELTAQLFERGVDLRAFSVELLEHFRTLLHIKLSPRASLAFLSNNDQETYRKSAERYTREHLLHLLDLLLQTEEQLSHLPLQQVGFEILLLQLLRSGLHPPLEQLVQRLIDLEKKYPPTEAKENVVPTSPIPKEESSKIGAQEPPPLATQLPVPKQGRYETLLRFAAVELEGTLIK